MYGKLRYTERRTQEEELKGAEVLSHVGKRMVLFQRKRRQSEGVLGRKVCEAGSGWGEG